MRSKAHIKSHPLHSILVVFPLACFAGTLLFDLAGLLLANASFAVTGGHLNVAGICTALIAAIPGTIDYFYTVPPKSSASRRGAKHALINIVVIVLFVVTLFYRRSEDHIPGVKIAIELVAVILLCISGWLGGTLVMRNQIGIDIRYANAGKWREEYIADTDGEVRVANVDEIELNQMKLIHFKGKRIVIGKTEGGFVAFDDRCPHRGGSLAGGSMMCKTVQCPWHGSQFDVQTGAMKAGPAKESIRVYTVLERDKCLYITLQDAVHV